jgi:pectinesterase
MTVANTAGVVGQHAFTTYGRGDRTVLLDSDILSDGADTVALWLGQSGRYYQTRCAFRGAVDFLCPRGWCYIPDSTFFETKSSAAVWHDGSGNKDMKLVLRNCSFDGVQGWYLARHHHDAQFFFLDGTFSATMIDRAPFRVIYPLNGGKANESDKKKNADLDKSNHWGERTYFWNCHRSGGDYAWHQDNLKQAAGTPAAEHITAAWTFGGKWDPDNPGAGDSRCLRSRPHDRADLQRECHGQRKAATRFGRWGVGRLQVGQWFRCFGLHGPSSWPECRGEIGRSQRRGHLRHGSGRHLAPG